MKRYEPNRWCRSKEEEEEVKSPLSHDTTTTTTTTTTRTTRTTKHIILIQIRIPKWKMSSVIILFKKKKQKKNKKIKCIIIIIIIIINFISIQFLKTTTRTQIRREIIKCFLYILWWFCPVLSCPVLFLCCLFLFLIIHLNFIRF